MEKIELHSLFEENNKILLDFFKNEFINIIKDTVVDDIKKEIYNLLFDGNIYKGISKRCGFIRTRKRGNCKRLTNQILCPYHLQKVKKEYENISLPDKISSGNSSGLYNDNVIDKENNEDNIYNDNSNSNNYLIDINNLW